MASYTGPSQADQGLRAGWQDHPRGGANRRFVTAQFALVWIERGAGMIRYGDREWPFQAGDAFKRLPGTPHDVSYEPGTRSHFLALPASVWEAMHACFVLRRNWMVIHPGTDRRIREGFERLAQRLRRAHGAERFRCMAAMQDFVGELHQLERPASGTYAFLERACDLLAADDGLPVPEIAAACGIPYSTFRQRFQHALGCSPMAWRISRRMERAQELLGETDLAIGAIADALAYCDVYRFSRHFREHTGLSPSAWRRRSP